MDDAKRVVELLDALSKWVGGEGSERTFALTFGGHVTKIRGWEASSSGGPRLGGHCESGETPREALESLVCAMVKEGQDLAKKAMVGLPPLEAVLRSQ